MHAGLDNGFSLMTDCLAVTHFMLNSFSLFNFTSVILWGVVLGWGGWRVTATAALSRRAAVPTSCNDSPALFLLYCFLHNRIASQGFG